MNAEIPKVCPHEIPYEQCANADCKKRLRAFAEPPGSEPVRRAFSQQEIVNAAKTWIQKSYPASDYDPDLRMQRLGLLIDFVTDLVPNDPS